MKRDMSQSTGNAPMARSEFLRWAALGTGGFGLAALAGCERARDPSGVNLERKRQGYVVAVTHGPDDATRVMLALAAAERLPEGDNHIWFAIDGGQIARKEVAEEVSSPLFPQQGTAAEMLEKIRAQGAAFHI